MTIPVSPARMRRAAAGVAAAGLLAAGIALVVHTGAGLPQLVAFALLPDLALVAGAGRGLAPGRLHPRAVPLYNALHRLPGPAALAAAVAAGLLPGAWLAGALAWAAHIAMDRAAGYGLRTPDGLQRA